MYKFSFYYIDNRLGNATQQCGRFLNTDDPFVALALALRILRWSEVNVEKALLEDNDILKNYLVKPDDNFPAVESTDEEQRDRNYEKPSYTHEHLYLVPLKGVPVSFEVTNLSGKPEELAKLVLDAVDYTVKHSMSPDTDDVIMATKLKLLAKH